MYLKSSLLEVHQNKNNLCSKAILFKIVIYIKFVSFERFVFKKK